MQRSPLCEYFPAVLGLLIVALSGCASVRPDVATPAVECEHCVGSSSYSSGNDANATEDSGPAGASAEQERPRVDGYSQSPFVSDRVAAVREAADNRLSLASHRTNYLLPFSYNDEMETAQAEYFSENGYKPLEMQFQLSVQVPVWSNPVGEGSFVSLAYTNRSFWQAYSRSGPFRESIHEPEILLTWLSDWELFGFQCVVSQLGINHQSNGRGDEYSRGWNRLFANFTFERDALFLSIKPWYKLPRRHGRENDRDIGYYMGNFQLETGYRSHGFGLTMGLRNNFRSDNRGAFELNFSFPVGQRVRGFLRYFDGYGETLVDYNLRQRSVGLGVELAQGF